MPLPHIQTFVVVIIMIMIYHLSVHMSNYQREPGWRFHTLPVTSHMEIASLRDNDATPFVHYTYNVQNVVYRRRGRLYRQY